MPHVVTPTPRRPLACGLRPGRPLPALFSRRPPPAPPRALPQRPAALGALLLALWLLFPTWAWAYGELVVLQGTATITRKGQVLHRGAGGRLDLLAGDRIETLWGSKAYLTLFWDTAGGEAMLDASPQLVEADGDQWQQILVASCRKVKNSGSTEVLCSSAG